LTRLQNESSGCCISLPSSSNIHPSFSKAKDETCMEQWICVSKSTTKAPMCSPLLRCILKILYKTRHDGVFLPQICYLNIKTKNGNLRCVRAARASPIYKSFVCDGSSLLLYIHTSVLFSKIKSNIESWWLCLFFQNLQYGLR